MASTGWTLAGNYHNDNSAGSFAWIDNSGTPSSTSDSDLMHGMTAGGFTHCWNYGAASGTGYILKCSQFGFAIPAGATIDGVYAYNTEQSNADSGNPVYAKSQLLVSGSYTGTDKGAGSAAMVDNSSYVDHYWGGVSDLWGCTLTATVCNASNFGWGIQCTNGPFNLAGVRSAQLNVYYTEAPPAVGVAGHMGIAL